MGPPPLLLLLVVVVVVAVGEALLNNGSGGDGAVCCSLGGEDDEGRRGKFGTENLSANGVYGVVGGAAGICGEVIFGEEVIVGGDDGNE